MLFYELGCTECDNRKTLSVEWRQAAAGLDAPSELGPPTSTPFLPDDTTDSRNSTGPSGL